VKFADILPFLLQKKIIQIEGEKWCLVLAEDKNLGTECIYISTNEYAQAWNPQKWQLESDKWIVVE
jgi:hypothetical protein